MSRLKQFLQRNKWLLPIVVLALVQLACLDHVFYENDIIEYCETPPGTLRFGSYEACLSSVSTVCPDPGTMGNRDEVCVDNWLNSPDAPVDCSTLVMTSPAVIYQGENSVTVTWSPVANIHYYELYVGQNSISLLAGRVNRNTTAYTVNLSPNQYLDATGPIQVVVRAMVGDNNLACSVQRDYTRTLRPVVQDCSVFRLTAPLDGLPNGMTTFYWDPLPGATGYRLSVADAVSPNTPLTSLSVGGGSTNVTLDLSSRRIGGGTSLVVTIEALNGETVACTDSRTLTRAWAVPPPPENTQPAPFCGDLVCNPELGEDNETCTIDCPLGG